MPQPITTPEFPIPFNHSIPAREGATNRDVDVTYALDARAGGKKTNDVRGMPYNWGRLMMHCHILEHAAAGRITEVEVGED